MRGYTDALEAGEPRRQCVGYRMATKCSETQLWSWKRADDRLLGWKLHLPSLRGQPDRVLERRHCRTGRSTLVLLALIGRSSVGQLDAVTLSLSRPGRKKKKETKKESHPALLGFRGVELRGVFFLGGEGVFPLFPPSTHSQGAAAKLSPLGRHSVRYQSARLPRSTRTPESLLD